MFRKLVKIAGIAAIAGTGYLVGETVGFRRGEHYGQSIGRIQGMFDVIHKIQPGTFGFSLPEN